MRRQGGARQPARRRAGRDPPARPCVVAARGARSRRSRRSRRTRWWAPGRSMRRSSKAAASSAAIPTAPPCRWSAGRCRPKRNRSRCTRFEQILDALGARGSRRFTATATAMFSRPAYEIAAETTSFRSVLAAAVAPAGGPPAIDRREFLDRRGRARSRRHPVGTVRPGRRRAALDGGIRQRRRRDALPRRAGRAGSAVLLRDVGRAGDVRARVRTFETTKVRGPGALCSMRR